MNCLDRHRSKLLTAGNRDSHTMSNSIGRRADYSIRPGFIGRVILRVNTTTAGLARISHQGAGWRFSAPAFHRIRASLHIIAQGFGFTRDFTLKGTEV
jgi:hypothetical protein